MASADKKWYSRPMPVRLQIRAQQVIASDIDALEERMWHDVNEYQLSLQQHLSDRDGLLNKIDRASQQLLLLKVGPGWHPGLTQLLLLCTSPDDRLQCRCGSAGTIAGSIDAAGSNNRVMSAVLCDVCSPLTC